MVHTVQFFNEVDTHAASWIRNLNPGHYVDDRSIVDLRSGDLAGYAQAHFFAGIGVWSYALELAGWPASRPVWTGSCPCQPFSDAGKRKGTDDARHLWPVWFDLIRECKPPTILGEQVASKAALGWFDAVSADLEGEGYAVAAADLCAASVGAPHIRQRLFWMAHAAIPGCERGRPSQAGNGRHAARFELERLRDAGGVENTTGLRQPRFGRERQNGIAEPSREYAEFEWLQCSDGKYRPTQPGIFPLAHGVAGRVAKLRAIGNAIVAPLAVEFIKTVIDILD